MNYKLSPLCITNCLLHESQTVFSNYYLPALCILIICSILLEHKLYSLSINSLLIEYKLSTPWTQTLHSFNKTLNFINNKLSTFEIQTVFFQNILILLNHINRHHIFSPLIYVHLRRFRLKRMLVVAHMTM